MTRVLQAAAPSRKSGQPRYWIVVDGRRVGMVTRNRTGDWFGIEFGAQHRRYGGPEGRTPEIAARRLLDRDVDYNGNLPGATRSLTYREAHAILLAPAGHDAATVRRAEVVLADFRGENTTTPTLHLTRA